jgi:hypothetical protein
MNYVHKQKKSPPRNTKIAKTNLLTCPLFALSAFFCGHPSPPFFIREIREIRGSIPLKTPAISTFEPPAPKKPAISIFPVAIP